MGCLQDSNNKEEILSLDANTKILRDGKEAKLADLKEGSVLPLAIVKLLAPTIQKSYFRGIEKKAGQLRAGIGANG